MKNAFFFGEREREREMAFPYFGKSYFCLDFFFAPWGMEDHFEGMSNCGGSVSTSDSKLYGKFS